MLWSLHQAEPETPFTVWLIHSHMRPEALESVRQYCGRFGWGFCPCEAGEELFADTPVFRHYTKAMYYRLLASRILPESVEKVLYLDPDILILNPISQLLNLPLEGNLFAAANHTGLGQQISAPVNRVRLHSNDSSTYFNSGVLVMDLEAQRRELGRRRNLRLDTGTCQRADPAGPGYPQCPVRLPDPAPGRYSLQLRPAGLRYLPPAQRR